MQKKVFQSSTLWSVIIIAILIVAVWYTQKHIAPRRYPQQTPTSLEQPQEKTLPQTNSSPVITEPVLSTEIPLLDPFAEQDTELDTLQAEIDSLSL